MGPWLRRVILQSCEDPGRLCVITGCLLVAYVTSLVCSYLVFEWYGNKRRYGGQFFSAHVTRYTCGTKASQAGLVVPLQEIVIKYRALFPLKL
jgi:hypothetical protein